MFGFLKNRGSQDAKAGAPKARKGKDGFYLEADESNAPAVENGTKPAPAEAVKVEAAPAVKPAPEPAKAEAPAAESAADKTTAKSKRAKALASAQEKKVEAAPQPAPAKPAAPAAANGKVQPEAIKTFAPDYLLTLTSTNGRRRPGANMNSFLQMARQVKTR